jgi:Protein of unknown function (DUF2924)
MGNDFRITLAKLPDLDHAALKKGWSELHETEVPRGMSRHLLRHAIAYRLQEKILGGLRPATRRYLKQMMLDDKEAIRPGRVVRPGTRLLREWHGVTYEVIVLDQGVMFQGRRHRSLSQVAREITGVKWSGPAFFGLNKKNRG